VFQVIARKLRSVKVARFCRRAISSNRGCRHVPVGAVSAEMGNVCAMGVEGGGMVKDALTAGENARKYH
jgi:hypothetical protein